MEFLKTKNGKSLLLSGTACVFVIAVILILSGTVGGLNIMGDSVQRINIKDANVNSISEKLYTGKPVTPNVVINYRGIALKKNVDYRLTYKNNINVGTASIIIAGTKKYVGTRTVTFKISKNPTVKVNNVATPGKTDTRTNTVTPGKVTSKTDTVKNSVTQNKVTDTKTNTPTPSKTTTKNQVTSLSQLKISPIANQFYTGRAVTPALNVVTSTGKKLVVNKDYTVKYTNNVNIGIATVEVNGKGSYLDSAKATFKIVGNIANVVISQIPAQVYTTKAITPVLVVKFGNTVLKNGVDYTVAYKNNVNPGVATVTVTGKGNYAGTKSATFTIINPISIVDVNGRSGGKCSTEWAQFRVQNTKNRLTKAEYSDDNGKTWTTFLDSNLVRSADGKTWTIKLRKNHSNFKIRVTDAAGLQKVVGPYTICNRPFVVENANRNLVTGVCGKGNVTFNVTDKTNTIITKAEISTDNKKWTVLGKNNFIKKSNSVWQIIIRKTYNKYYIRMTNGHGVVQTFGPYKSCVK